MFNLINKEDNGSGKIPKPKQLKGLLLVQIKKNIITAICLSIATGCLFKHFYMDRRKKNYAEFYKNFDCDVAFERMDYAGLMQTGVNWENGEEKSID